jgi:hypothetical protein
MNDNARRYACSLTLVSLLGSVPVRAEPATGVDRGTEPERARSLREQGNQAMLDMRYVDALGLYDQARSLDSNDVGVDYSIARARQLLGDFPEALTALERFDERASPEVKAKVGRLDQLFAELRSRISTLQLKCSQAGARVLLRDKVIGLTPLASVRLPAGAATLQVELDGFFPVRREVVLPAGGAIELEVTLHARSRSALLHVKTSPSGARVAVDGQNIGTSSPRVELVLPAGSHQVIAQREGYDDASVPVVLAPGTTRELMVPLERTLPVTSRWWFWTGAALLVAGGAALTVALLRERPADQGTLPPGQVSAPLQVQF